MTLAAGVSALAAAAAAAQQPPVFRSGVDLLAVDVTVLDAAGDPVRGLDAAAFTVRVDGQVRRVVDVQWIAPAAASAAVPPALPAGLASNVGATDGRLIAIVVDQQNIAFGSMSAIQDAIGTFVDRLEPADRVAVIGFDLGNAGTPFTGDRERVKRALAALNGRRDVAAQGRHEVGVVAAREFERGYTQGVQAIIARDCFGNSRQRQTCADEVMEEARTTAVRAARDLDLTVQRLRDLLTTLQQIEPPKTLLFVSDGFVLPPEDGATRIAGIGELAARARTTIYALRIGDDRGSIELRASPDATRERAELSRALETLAAAGRGAMLTVVGTGSGVFERISRELSGYYLLGVESTPQTRDGRAHPVHVDVNRHGVTVRARQVAIGGARAVTPAPRQRAIDAVRSPLMLPGLPLEAAAYAMRGTDADHLQLLVHAEVGGGYSSPHDVSTAMDVVDAQGRSVGQQATDVRLTPSIAGVPSPLRFTAGAPVAPGDYVVRIAVVDGDRAGSVELPVHAALEPAGAVRTSTLIVGGPVPPGSLLAPAIGYQVRFGMVQGYFEAYGPAANDAVATFEVAVSDAAAALTSIEVAARRAGADRSIFTAMIPVQVLPPGTYRLRAVLGAEGGPPVTLRGAFAIPDVAASPPSSPLYLPVEDASIERLFAGSAAARSASVPNVTPDSAAATGAALMRGRAFGPARQLFDDAARRWPDDPRFTIGVACLDAMFGRGREAMLALDRYLAAAPDDPEALFLAVAWRVEARRAGVALDGAADLDRVRRYAARYRAAAGPRQPLVDLWTSYLETSTR